MWSPPVEPKYYDPAYKDGRNRGRILNFNPKPQAPNTQKSPNPSTLNVFISESVLRMLWCQTLPDVDKANSRHFGNLVERPQGSGFIGESTGSSFHARCHRIRFQLQKLARLGSGQAVVSVVAPESVAQVYVSLSAGH